MAGESKFVFLDADDQASRIVINLDSIAWIWFDGDQFNAKSAKIHFVGRPKALRVLGSQAAFLQGELDSIVMKRNSGKKTSEGTTPRNSRK